MKSILPTAGLTLPCAFALSVSACSAPGDDGVDTDGGCATPVVTDMYVLDTLSLPTDRSTFSADLNGDGTEDNQFGNFLGALAANNVDSQASQDQFIASGEASLLLRHETSDTTYAHDECSHAELYAATATAGAPDFSGAGAFTIDSAVPPASFTGVLSSGSYAGTIDRPVDDTLTIRISIAHVVVPVRLVGARLSFRRVDDALTEGQINGAVTKVEIDTVVVPSLAAALNERVQANPGGETERQLLQIFDTGATADGGDCPCQNVDGTCVAASDGKIAVCEVAQNSLIEAVLNPDVQMFDGAGGYAPSAANLQKDSLSLGVGFTAVEASF